MRGGMNVAVNNTRPRISGLGKISLGAMSANLNTAKANEYKEEKGISEIEKTSRKKAANAVHLRRRFSQMYASTRRRRASHSAHSLRGNCEAVSIESMLSAEPDMRHFSWVYSGRELFFGWFRVNAG